MGFLSLTRSRVRWFAPVEVGPASRVVDSPFEIRLVTHPLLPRTPSTPSVCFLSRVFRFHTSGRCGGLKEDLTDPSYVPSQVIRRHRPSLARRERPGSQPSRRNVLDDTPFLEGPSVPKGTERTVTRQEKQQAGPSDRTPEELHRLGCVPHHEQTRGLVELDRRPCPLPTSRSCPSSVSVWGWGGRTSLPSTSMEEETRLGEPYPPKGLREVRVAAVEVVREPVAVVQVLPGFTDARVPFCLPRVGGMVHPKRKFGRLSVRDFGPLKRDWNQEGGWGSRGTGRDRETVKFRGRRCLPCVRRVWYLREPSRFRTRRAGIGTPPTRDQWVSTTETRVGLRRTGGVRVEVWT